MEMYQDVKGIPGNRLKSPGLHLSQANENLSMFMDYCTYGHMIDNVVLIVTGTLHERDVQVREGRGLVGLYLPRSVSSVLQLRTEDQCLTHSARCIRTPKPCTCCCNGVCHSGTCFQAGGVIYPQARAQITVVTSIDVAHNLP